MVSTWRCSICALNWPPLNAFKTCPQCGEANTPFSNAQPMSDAEAGHILSYLKFNAHYESSRGVHPDADTDPADDPLRSAHPLESID